MPLPLRPARPTKLPVRIHPRVTHRRFNTHSTIKQPYWAASRQTRSIHPRTSQNQMGRFFITGSSDGLGSLTAQRLVASGHEVVLHARNAQRAADAAKACPGAVATLVGDLSKLEETKRLAAEAQALGPYEAVLHNAGVGAGMPHIFAVNTVAPYVLACLMADPKPKRLVFVSSGLHRSGRLRLDRLRDDAAAAAITYSDSKLHDVMLAKAFARRWPAVQSNAVHPGWVPTKMGGRGAPERADDGVDTFVMAALGEGAAKGKTGRYFAKSREEAPLPAADDVQLQDRLVEELAKITGVEIPE